MTQGTKEYYALYQRGTGENAGKFKRQGSIHAELSRPMLEIATGDSPFAILRSQQEEDLQPLIGEPEVTVKKMMFSELDVKKAIAAIRERSPKRGESMEQAANAYEQYEREARNLRRGLVSPMQA